MQTFLNVRYARTLFALGSLASPLTYPCPLGRHSTQYQTASTIAVYVARLYAPCL
jgi:hypothetical protein